MDSSGRAGGVASVFADLLWARKVFIRPYLRSSPHCLLPPAWVPLWWSRTAFGMLLSEASRTVTE